MYVTRRSGRSTALALYYISTAISQPGRPIKIIELTEKSRTLPMDRQLFYLCANIINKLNLKFSFNKNNLTICSENFGIKVDTTFSGENI